MGVLPEADLDHLVGPGRLGVSGTTIGSGEATPLGLDIQDTYTGGNGLLNSPCTTVLLTWQRCMRHAEPLKSA